jgi:hypothetical protein
MESGVVTPKIRERFEKPDMIQLRALPDVLRKLAERLRVQAADRLLSQLTVGHFPSPSYRAIRVRGGVRHRSGGRLGGHRRCGGQAITSK